MSDAGLARCEVAISDFMGARVQSGTHCTIKFHTAPNHLVGQMRFAGNCTHTQNYRDESDNFNVKKIGHSLYRPLFAENFLVKWLFQHLLDSYEL